MRRILVLDEYENYNPTAFEVHSADLIIRRVVRCEYEVVKNRYGPTGKVTSLDDIDFAS